MWPGFHIVICIMLVWYCLLLCLEMFFFYFSFSGSFLLFKTSSSTSNWINHLNSSRIWLHMWRVIIDIMIVLIHKWHSHWFAHGLYNNIIVPYEIRLFCSWPLLFVVCWFEFLLSTMIHKVKLCFSDTLFIKYFCRLVQ